MNGTFTSGVPPLPAASMTLPMLAHRDLPLFCGSCKQSPGKAAVLRRRSWQSKYRNVSRFSLSLLQLLPRLYVPHSHHGRLPSSVCICPCTPSSPQIRFSSSFLCIDSFYAFLQDLRHTLFCVINLQFIVLPAETVWYPIPPKQSAAEQLRLEYPSWKYTRFKSLLCIFQSLNLWHRL